MPERKPRTKAPKGEQLGGTLQGDLALYDKVGLFQHSISKKTAYRYRGCLLHYQEALQGDAPSLARSKMFLAHLREEEYSASSLNVHRAALKGYHQWKGEVLEFAIKKPHHNPKYVEASIVNQMLELAKTQPLDYLILLLLSHAGLRRAEVVNLEVGNVGDKALRFRGKEDKDRTVPMTPTLLEAIKPFCEGKKPNDKVIGYKEKYIYELVKKYAALIGRPDIKPHDLRHAFATRLNENRVSLMTIKELLGHADVGTTQVYTQVSGVHLEDAIQSLDSPVAERQPAIQKFPEANLSSQKEYIESPQSLKMRGVAKALADGIGMPSYFDKKLWADLPVEFRPGTYYLPIGTVVIDKAKQVQIKYQCISAGIAEKHFIKGLYDHLITSGSSKYSELVGETGKLNTIAFEIEQYSRSLIEFLKLIKDEIEKTKLKVKYSDDIKHGLTKWFITTIWNDVLCKASGSQWITDSWYKSSVSASDSQLCELKCGGYPIGIAENDKTLKSYKNLHQSLRIKFSDHSSARAISTKEIEIGDTVVEIKERLQEFSDLKHLPGHCELC
jgi:integrase/recombinase XerD